MKLPRCSGILLHPTSLPSRFGIGDLGKESHGFIGQMAAAGQTVWQMLPLGPPGMGHSPYQCYSAFAGNPLLISPEMLVDEGHLTSADIEGAPACLPDQVDFEAVSKWKLAILTRAFKNIATKNRLEADKSYNHFCRDQAFWLDDYSLFSALKESHGHDQLWTTWESDLVKRKPAALKQWRDKLADQISLHKFWQFTFFEQWGKLRDRGRKLGILFMGDLPIYVSQDSADVWAHPENFELQEDGRPRLVAGVPPDYFSETGQLWRNPIYSWDEMKRDNFSWWKDRLRSSLQMFDIVRLDHFRGFEAYWAVPSNEETAVNGKWIKAPGAELFQAVETTLGPPNLVAEDLGDITPEVVALRKQFNFPGMAVLQFAFSIDALATQFRPHNFERELFAYTGTHDNDTTMGWWESTGGDSTRTEDDVRKEKELALRYLGADGREINWTLIRALMASVANVAIIPMQDVLGLGSESRMNKPGVATGNWSWRMLPGAFKRRYQERLLEMAEVYDRIPKRELPQST